MAGRGRSWAWLDHTADVRSRIGAIEKEAAEAVLADCGLDMSSAIRLFLRQVVLRRGLPFDVSVPNAATIAAMEEARGAAPARYANARELIDEVEAEVTGLKKGSAASKR